MEKKDIWKTMMSCKPGDIVKSELGKEFLVKEHVGMVTKVYYDGIVVLKSNLETVFFGVEDVDGGWLKKITILEKDDHNNRVMLLNRAMKDVVRLEKTEKENQE